ncbi:MAG: TerB family tellurite resistance protein [Xanthobacteraceae bacterium]
MLDSLIKFVSELADDRKDANRLAADDHRLAAAALLVHAAVIDGALSDAEREKLYALIKQRFKLGEDEAAELLELAYDAEREAVDLYSFTSLLNRIMDEAARRRLVEMMWEVVYADGSVSEFEDNLLWRAADLLHVPSRERIELRRRVAGKKSGEKA